MAWKTFDKYGRLLVSTDGASCAPVAILDEITHTIIGLVPSGGTYGVLQFSGIQDSGPPYTNSIIPA